jgi:hypothetical protein
MLLNAASNAGQEHEMCGCKGTEERTMLNKGIGVRKQACSSLTDVFKEAVLGSS